MIISEALCVNAKNLAYSASNTQGSVYQCLAVSQSTIKAAIPMMILIGFFLTGYRRIKILGSDNLSGVHASFGVALVDVAEAAVLAVWVASTPRIPHVHYYSTS